MAGQVSLLEGRTMYESIQMLLIWAFDGSSAALKSTQAFAGTVDICVKMPAGQWQSWKGKSELLKMGVD